MTQAGPLTLAPATPLAPASGWLPRIGTLTLLVGVGLLVLPPLLYLAAAAVKAGELGAVTIGSLVGLAVTTLSLATLATIWRCFWPCHSPGSSSAPIYPSGLSAGGWR